MTKKDDTTDDMFCVQRRRVAQFQ